MSMRPIAVRLKSILSAITRTASRHVWRASSSQKRLDIKQPAARYVVDELDWTPCQVDALFAPRNRLSE